MALLGGDSRIIERRRDRDDVAFLSIVSHVELIPGLYIGRRPDRRRTERLHTFLEEVELLHFGAPEVSGYEQIIAARGFSRRLVADRMIAATALANDLTLATLNARDFRDIPGLKIEDWRA